MYGRPARSWNWLSNPYAVSGMERGDGRPSLLGVLALSLAALVVTLLAVINVSVWESNNVPGNVVLDLFAIFVAVWVDWRAIRAWRNFLRHAASN
jgi:hypothetical protein